ncbi:MAG TPA: sigma 54-interacting transcriptional regulator [bacterium]|mgnify:CR=1 FL=1|nr:sigma 54-interacting transcriptional regulator [bacterium]
MRTSSSGPKHADPGTAASPPAAANPQVRREVRELSFLFKLSQLLDRELALDELAMPLLGALAEHLGLRRGTLTLFDRETGEISIEAAVGLSAAQRRKGRYRLGEGITGEVIASGQPAVIPHIGAEPRFLNRTGVRGGSTDDLSFICVPIKTAAGVAGAVSADRVFPGTAALNDDVRLLTIVAAMIARAAQLRAVARHEELRLRAENTLLQEALRERFRPDTMIGNSAPMQELYGQIASVAGSDTTVLIRGESGVGKELVARAIHAHSPRAGKPLITVNCAALPDTLIESELFGHEKGSFTGAVALRRGRFELADGGTIFLDEIGDLSPALQVKLLRVLQERSFERLGGSHTMTVDVRVITATNRALEEMLDTGGFRRDLYYRLNVFPVYIPPLRERPSDIMALADAFVTRYAQRNRRSVRRIATPAIDMLMAYHWPGNVRELENCIERAVLLCRDGVIHAHHLPPTLQTAEASHTAPRGTLRSALAAVERDMVLDALKSARGNAAAAARALDISEREMGLRLRRFGIDRGKFKPVRPQRRGRKID